MKLYGEGMLGWVCSYARMYTTELEFLNDGAPELIPRNEFLQPMQPGRYDNPIPPRFLAPIDFLKIPAQEIAMQIKSANQLKIHRRPVMRLFCILFVLGTHLLPPLPPPSILQITPLSVLSLSQLLTGRFQLCPLLLCAAGHRKDPTSAHCKKKGWRHPGQGTGKSLTFFYSALIKISWICSLYLRKFERVPLHLHEEMSDILSNICVVDEENVPLI